VRPRRHPALVDGREAGCGIRACRLAGLSPPICLCAGARRHDCCAVPVALARPNAHRRGDFSGNGGGGGLHRIARQMRVAIGGCRLGIPSILPMIGKPIPLDAATDANAYRRSCSRTSSSPAALRIARHGFSDQSLGHRSSIQAEEAVNQRRGCF